MTAAEELKKPAEDAAFLGELSLTGALRPVKGVLPMALAAVRAGIKTLYLPKENAAEATLADGLTVYGVPTIMDLVAHLRGETLLTPEENLDSPRGNRASPRSQGRDGAGKLSQSVGSRGSRKSQPSFYRQSGQR